MTSALVRDVLLVEDDAGDVRLTLEAFIELGSALRLHVARDGVEAMSFLRRAGVHVEAPRPDLVPLDLDLRRFGGREVLAAAKADEDLRSIPIAILTGSEAQSDVLDSHQLQANCYLTKPVLLEEFEVLVKSIDDFWLTRDTLPARRQDP